MPLIDQDFIPRALRTGGQLSNYEEDLVWGYRRPHEVRMIPYNNSGAHYANNFSPNYLNRYGTVYKGDLHPYFKDGASGEGLFDIVSKIPWGKVFEIGSKVAPTLIDTGFKVADKFKSDPNIANAQSKQELIAYFKHLLSQETDPKLRMEIIREIGKLK